MNLLTLNLLWPLFSILFISIFSWIDDKKLHNYSLILASVSVILSLLLWLFFDMETTNFQYQSEVFILPFTDLSLSLGIDGISIFFILLTNLFTYLCILSLSTPYNRFFEIILYLFALQFGVLFAFSVLDILGFFIFFELTLIPIYLLILIWGSRERKIRASYLIAVYTMFGSIFMFFNILYLYSKTGFTDYNFLLTLNFTIDEQKFLWITFFIAFAAKIPLFPVHVWLPEAHVEAPTVGSVLLAALLLKVGTYGIIRFALPLFPYGSIYFAPLIYTFAVCGILYTSLTAMRQIDLKKIIAYASVGHMNVVLLGIMALNIEGLEGAIFQMLSHGIIAGALFFCVGVLYDRYKIRSLKYFGGVASLYPLYALVFLTFAMANISFPGTSSFVGEFLIFSGTYAHNTAIVFFGSISMVLGAVYTLWMYNRIFFGHFRNTAIYKTNDLTFKEMFLFGILIIILFIMGIYATLFLDTMHSSCTHLLKIISIK